MSELGKKLIAAARAAREELKMDTWFFYYIRHLVTDKVSPRLSYGWPPVGGEINPVLQRFVISEEEAKLSLDDLSKQFPLDV